MAKSIRQFEDPAKKVQSLTIGVTNGRSKGGVLCKDNELIVDMEKVRRAAKSRSGAGAGISNVKMSGSGRLQDLSCIFCMIHNGRNAWPSITDF